MKEESYNALSEYLRIVEGKFGKISIENSQALVRVSSVYSFFQDYRQAIKIAEQALEVRQGLYGEVHRHTGQAYYNVGVM